MISPGREAPSACFVGVKLSRFVECVPDTQDPYSSVVPTSNTSGQTVFRPWLLFVLRLRCQFCCQAVAAVTSTSDLWVQRRLPAHSRNPNLRRQCPPGTNPNRKPQTRLKFSPTHSRSPSPNLALGPWLNPPFNPRPRPHLTPALWNLRRSPLNQRRQLPTQAQLPPSLSSTPASPET